MVTFMFGTIPVAAAVQFNTPVPVCNLQPRSNLDPSSFVPLLLNLQVYTSASISCSISRDSCLGNYPSSLSSTYSSHISAYSSSTCTTILYDITFLSTLVPTSTYYYNINPTLRPSSSMGTLPPTATLGLHLGTYQAYHHHHHHHMSISPRAYPVKCRAAAPSL